jgi:hypothetical protein
MDAQQQRQPASAILPPESDYDQYFERVTRCWAGDVRWRDEKIEIALSRSSFPSGGHFSPASGRSGNISRSNGICCASLLRKHLAARFVAWREITEVTRTTSYAF